MKFSSSSGKNLTFLGFTSLGLAARSALAPESVKLLDLVQLVRFTQNVPLLL